MIYKLLFVENKEQFKEYIKSAGTRILGILIPVIFMTVYLLVTNSLIDFINYAILGIKTFSNKIAYILSSSGSIQIDIDNEFNFLRNKLLENLEKIC